MTDVHPVTKLVKPYIMEIYHLVNLISNTHVYIQIKTEHFSHNLERKEKYILTSPLFI